MKVIVTGGGTGGHINPAIAIAQKIQQIHPESEILYVGTERGLESEMVPRMGLRFETIPVKGFRRKLSLDTLKTAAVLMKGLGEAGAILDRERPDLVIGTGGYVCGPVVFMAALKKIRTLIHEQNAMPGATNRILGRLVDTVCISYEESRRIFQHAKRLALTGNPVREAFVGLNRKDCRARLSIPETAFLVVSTGGSGGAGAINRAVGTIFHKSPQQDLIWVHITGKNHYTEFIGSVPELSENGCFRAQAFSHDMPLLLGAADLVVSRSGALIIAELGTAGVPSILIPSPNVANRHQDFNALICEAAGMSRILWEKDLNAESLWAAVEAIRADEGLRNAMGAAAQHMSMANAADRIAEEVFRLVP